MRVIGEIPHPACKITLFQWNNRYLIKLEAGHLEQTYKVDQFSIASEEELSNIVSDRFVSEAIERFNGMHNSLSKAMEDL
jgi:hypothetical protein